jgi:hypothetical protein
MNRTQQKAFNDVLTTYGKDSPHMQAVIAGLALYETYKDDRDFQEVMVVDRSLRTLYTQILELFENLQNVIRPALRNSTGIKYKNLLTASKEHEDRIAQLTVIYRQTRHDILGKSEQFGFPLFDKKIETESF